MQDVAALAGVSVQTVSNYVNGRLSKLSPSTQATVRDAIDRLDYRVNNSARGLRSTRTRTIGFLALDDDVRFLADPLTGLYLAGIGDIARERAYSVLVHSAAMTPDGAAFLRPIHEHRVDAACVLMSGAPEVRRRVVELVDATGIEFVLFDETDVASGSARAMTVGADQEGGARVLVDDLLDRGHRRIGFIAAATPWAVVEQRFAGYTAALAGRGIAVDPALTRFEAGWAPSGAAPMVDALLALHEPPTALVCGSDLLALGACRAVRDHGRRVPEDVAVCGFDDFDFSAQTSPALTTVAVPAFEMGRIAAQTLVDLLEGRPPTGRSVVLPTELVRRESA